MDGMVRWLLLAVLLTSMACKKAPEKPKAPPRDGGPRLSIEITLPWERGLPMLTSIGPAPAGYDKAVATYKTATTALAHDEIDRATATFLDLAKILQLPKANPHHATYAAARCMIYQNVGAIDRAVADHTKDNVKRDAAKRRLEALAVTDPTCAASIAYAVDRLSITGSPSPVPSHTLGTGGHD